MYKTGCTLQYYSALAPSQPKTVPYNTAVYPAHICTSKDG